MIDERKYAKGMKSGLARVAIVTAIAAACAGMVSVALAPDAPTAVAPAHAQDPATPPGASGPADPAAWITGTVSAVDASAGTIDVLTGVGYALRIQRIHLPPDLEIKAGRARSTTSALTPGSIVRVRYRDAAGRRAASTVELLQAPPRGVER